MGLSFRLENRFLRREASKLFVRPLEKMKPTFPSLHVVCISDTNFPTFPAAPPVRVGGERSHTKAWSTGVCSMLARAKAR